MPELPEVESIRLQLEDKCKNKKIKKAWSNYPALFDSETLDVHLLTNQTILSLRRHGKYLILELDDYELIIHLGMSGVLLYNDDRGKHLHFQCTFSDGSVLNYFDPRKFGYLNLKEKEASLKRLSQMGPDVLSATFSKKYFKESIQKSGMDIKSFLLDQKKQAGIGNIYASEILFSSAVHPLRKANSLLEDEADLIVKHSKRIMKLAVKNRGTTFSDYKLTNGKDGQFQKFLKVFQKEKKECPVCRTPIQKVVIAQRSTFYCEACQR